MRIFHSYQYIQNSKNLFIDHENNIIKNNEGKFILGLLGIPKIKDIRIVIEKILVMKRLSKKATYKNHTKHNIKIFMDFTKKNLELFLYKSTNNEKNMFFTILRQNYISYTLNSNINDIMCIKQYSNNLVKKTFEINKNLEISLNNLNFNLLQKSIINKQSCKEIIMFSGGCIVFNINDSIATLLNLGMLNLKTHRSVFILNNSSYCNLLKLKINKYIESDPYFRNIKLFNQQNYIEAIKYLSNYKTSNIFIFDENILKKIEEDLDSYYIKNIWWISNNFKIIDLISLVKLNKDIDNTYFLNLNNLHQLSKLITPLSNQIKSKIKTQVIEVNEALKNLINYSRDTKIKEQNLTQNMSICSICMETPNNVIKFGCGHNICCECFSEFYTNTNSSSNINCVQCTQSIINTETEIFLLKKSCFKNDNIIAKFMNKIYKFISKNQNTKIGLISSDKITSFLKEVIHFMDSSRDVTIYKEYSNLYLLKNYCFITDYSDISCLENSNILILK